MGFGVFENYGPVVGFWVWTLGFGAWGLGLDLGFRVSSSG